MIQNQPEVPEWVDDKPLSDINSEGQADVLFRRVRENSVWRCKQFYRPEIVKDYNSFMGGVDLCDQIGSLSYLDGGLGGW